MEDTKLVGVTGLSEPAQDATTNKTAKATQRAVPAARAQSMEHGKSPGAAKTTKPGDRSWRYAGGAFLGVVGLWLLIQAPGWVTGIRETRIQKAVDTVTPERLIARCGQPMEDVTKEVFPVIGRTMSYKPWGQGKVVFSFSRTAEEKSDWVFLFMKDESGEKTYSTPDEQIAALPCLDSRK
jgi:hypothetical protein